MFVRQDVTKEEDWDAAVAAAEKLGGLHGLVNNAGIYQPRTLMETDSDLFRRHMEINQFGCFLGMKAVVPAMKRSGGGSIVNISSVAGLRGSPGAIAYSATKWALRGMTKAAASDLAASARLMPAPSQYAHSPWLPVPAPAPCRLTSRSAHAPARARSRARCS